MTLINAIRKKAIDQQKNMAQIAFADAVVLKTVPIKKQPTIIISVVCLEVMIGK